VTPIKTVEAIMITINFYEHPSQHRETNIYSIKKVEAVKNFHYYWYRRLAVERRPTMIYYQNRDGSFLSEEHQPSLRNNGVYYTHQSTRYINVSLGENGYPLYKNKLGIAIEIEKYLPELYESREKCCGCAACFSICGSSGTIYEEVSIKNSKYSQFIESIPITGAITMLPDEEGFLYPVVDAERCVRCFKCLNVCPLHK
jgi:ferredoxin